jgi:hypothetical protein
MLAGTQRAELGRRIFSILADLKEAHMSDIVWTATIIAIVVAVACLIYLLAGRKRRGITFEGGPGDTIERAVIIRGAPNEALGVQAEYVYLAREFGRPRVDWELVGQGLTEHGDRAYDEMHIKLADGTERTIFFDITQFFGKGSEDIPPPW